MNDVTVDNKPSEARPVATVWIVHDKGGLDFKDAARFGTVRRLFEGRFNPFLGRAAVREAAEKFEQAGPHDWLVLSGNSMANVAAALAFYRRFNRVNALVFDALTRRYEMTEMAWDV